MRRTIVNQLLLLIVFLIFTTAAQATTVRVAFPDGKPAAHAKVLVTIDGKYEFPVVADEDGEFLFPSNDFRIAVIALSSDEGTQYLPLTLSSEIINIGNLSFVIQSAH